MIVPSAGAADNNFFPVFSPGSKWIAYVNATTKSKDAVTATLRLVEHAVAVALVVDHALGDLLAFRGALALGYVEVACDLHGSVLRLRVAGVRYLFGFLAGTGARTIRGAATDHQEHGGDS